MWDLISNTGVVAGVGLWCLIGWITWLVVKAHRDEHSKHSEPSA